MKLTLIRNATLRLEYAGQLILVDPYLAAAKTLPAYAGKSENPLVDLPIPAEMVVEGAAAVLVSHTHTDHFDPVAQELLPKNLPLFCQPADAAFIAGKGFARVFPIATELSWRGIHIRRTDGRHGSSDSVLADMGTVSGFVLRAAGEPTLYLAGDTVWTDAVAAEIDRTCPDVIVTHSGGAVWGDGEFIVMDAAQTVAVAEYAPHSKIIAVHLEALDHCTVSRKQLKKAAKKAGIGRKLLIIPADGETVKI